MADGAPIPNSYRTGPDEAGRFGLFGGRFVLAPGSGLTIGDFAAFVFLFELIQWPMLALGWIANIAQRGLGSWTRLREIFDEEPDILDNDETDHTR